MLEGWIALGALCLLVVVLGILYLDQLAKATSLEEDYKTILRALYRELERECECDELKWDWLKPPEVSCG